MAEKITLEEFEKRQKKKNKLLWPLRIFVILFIAALISIVTLVIIFVGEIKWRDEEINRLDEAVNYWILRWNNEKK